MQATQPTEAPQETGSADDKAAGILEAYFTEEPEKAEDEPILAETVEDQPAPEEPETAAPEGEEGEQEYTLAELAESLEVDPAALYAAQVAMPDGTKIPVGKMKDEWQAAQKALGETQAKEEQLERAYSQLQQQQQMLTAQQGMAQLQPDEEEQRLYADWAAYDRAEKDQAYWDAQAQKDPGSAALAMQRLQGLKRDLESKLQTKQGERTQKAQQQQQEMARIAHQEIHQRIPEWSTEATTKADWTDISALWSRFGMPQDQVNALWQSPAAMHFSHSFLKLLRQLNGAPEKKKVVPIKGLKSGKRIDKKPTRASALKQQVQGKGKRERDNIAAQALGKFLRG